MKKFLRAWHNEKEPPDERVCIDSLATSVGKLLVAIDNPSVKMEQIETLVQKMSGDGFEQACLDELIASLGQIISDVIKQNGRVEVRYVGDLKPIKYDLHARFYHLTQHSTDEGLRKIIQDSITRGRSEVTLINLANVRDIKISIGNASVIELSSELAVVQKACEKFREWDEAGYWAKLDEE